MRVQNETIEERLTFVLVCTILIGSLAKLLNFCTNSVHFFEQIPIFFVVGLNCLQYFSRLPLHVQNLSGKSLQFLCVVQTQCRVLDNGVTYRRALLWPAHRTEAESLWSESEGNVQVRHRVTRLWFRGWTLTHDQYPPSSPMCKHKYILRPGEPFEVSRSNAVTGIRK